MGQQGDVGGSEERIKGWLYLHVPNNKKGWNHKNNKQA